MLFMVLGGVSAGNTCLAQNYTAQFNTNCQEAYTHILSLQVQKGQALLAEEKQKNPENVLPYLLENYADLFTIFIQEQAVDLERLEPNKEKRLRKIKKLNKNSPYYQYAQAEIHLQWAIARLKFEQYFKAFTEVRKAYKLLADNQRRFPDFYPNLKSLGIIHALVGTIPDQFQWGIKLLGLQGNIKQGMEEIEQFLDASAQNDYLFYDEAILIYTFFLIYLENNPDAAWQVAENLPTQNNLLNTFVAADIAMRTSKNNTAIELLKNRPKGNEFLDFYLADFFLGATKLQRLDKDADEALLVFVNNFKGKSYLKSAYQQLAWHQLLQGNTEQYHYYMQQCLVNGSTLIDADRQANKTAKSKTVPNITLLKARLLFDGAYFSKADELLQNFKTIDFKTPLQKLEFNYRYARIKEGLGEMELAISYYQQTMEQAINLENASYFAPKSCLQLGKIYEAQNKPTQARQFYKQCLQYKNYEYKNSMDQQAKAGLGRLAGKK